MSVKRTCLTPMRTNRHGFRGNAVIFLSCPSLRAGVTLSILVLCGSSDPAMAGSPPDLLERGTF